MNVRQFALSRRRLLHVGGMAAAAAVLPKARTAYADTLPANADRAVATYNALLRYLDAGIELYHEADPQSGDPASVVAAATTLPADTAQGSTAHKGAERYLDATIRAGLYREAYPHSSNPYSYLWPFSQALEGTLDLYQLGLVSRDDTRDHYRSGLPKYRDTSNGLPRYASYVFPPAGQGGDTFYDDNAWVGLNLARSARMMADPTTLVQAQEAFASIISGWDTNPTDPHPGGVFWKQQIATETNHDRNTVSNAPSAELGLRLYQLTGQSMYFDWGKQLYDWVNAALRDPVDGLYQDHVRQDGTIDGTKWSYNQGTMIGANVLLYQCHRTSAPAMATKYLTQAKAIAGTALAYYGQRGYSAQDPAFNAIFWRNLLLLASVDTTHLAATKQAMQTYADSTWTKNRREDNLYYFPANAPTATLVNQAAMIAIHACLAWPDSAYDLLV
jgi:hypothetical protein